MCMHALPTQLRDQPGIDIGIGQHLAAALRGKLARFLL